MMHRNTPIRSNVSALNQSLRIVEYESDSEYSEDGSSSDDGQYETQQARQWIVLPHDRPVQGFQSEFNAPVGAVRAVAHRHSVGGQRGGRVAFAESDPSEETELEEDVDMFLDDQQFSAKRMAQEIAQHVAEEQEEKQEQLAAFRRTLMQRLRAHEEASAEQEALREEQLHNAIHTHINLSNRSRNGDAGELRHAAVGQRMDTMRASTSMARQALVARSTAAQQAQEEEERARAAASGSVGRKHGPAQAWTAEGRVVDVRGGQQAEYPHIVTQDEDDSFVVDDYGNAAGVRASAAAVEAGLNDSRDQIVVKHTERGVVNPRAPMQVLYHPKKGKGNHGGVDGGSSSRSSNKGNSGAGGDKKDFEWTAGDEKRMYDQVRRNEMILERKRVQQRNERAKRAERAAKRKAVRERRKRQKEAERERQRAEEEERQRQEASEEKDVQKETRTRTIQAEKKKVRKQREHQRYVEALQKNLMDKIDAAVKSSGQELPQLCDCGIPLLQNHAQSCANNCIYYGNPDGYLKALVDLLVCMGIE